MGPVDPILGTVTAYKAEKDAKKHKFINAVVKLLFISQRPVFQTPNSDIHI